ncbi:MAG: STAS domain-containing protein [Granulosicoccus sp.]|nr:STAS domain-containing protein [Granulosicoccus sp.]
MSVTIALDDGTIGAQDAARRCLVSGALDFTTAKAARDEVASLIAEYESLIIDLSGVDTSNSAGLALLIDWLAVAKQSQHSVTFSHIPDSLRQLAEVCQVSDLL